MGARTKKYPEVELPAVLFGAVKDYIGPRRFAKLTPQERTKILEVCTACSKGIAANLAAVPPSEGAG